METNQSIPVIILSGGHGINIGTENNTPKGLLLVNKKTLLERIFEHYITHGFCTFFIAAGKGIKEIENLAKEFLKRNPKISITVINTGDENKTGSRIAQMIPYVKNANMVALTYSDTYANVNLDELIKEHVKSSKKATLIAVNNRTRFRILGLVDNDNTVRGFSKKPILDKDFINGGFYILNSSVFLLKSLSSDINCVFENEVLEELIQEKELNSFKHFGLWQPVDSERDIREIENLLQI